VRSALAKSGAGIQSVTEGGTTSGVVYDEYSIVIDTMPAGLTPEAFLEELAQDVNRAVYNEVFDSVNVFRRLRAAPGQRAAVGDIHEIDISGPDNGSVMLVERTPRYFVFQTIITSFWATGAHPEYGSREFGFERRPDGSIMFYTRGVSRAANDVVELVGAGPQQKGWTALLAGIAATLAVRGGKPRTGSFAFWKTHG